MSVSPIVPNELNNEIYTDLEIAQAHALADLTLAASVAARSIFGELALLRDARHALEHGSPEVTLEFLERSIAKLEDTRLSLLATLKQS